MNFRVTTLFFGILLTTLWVFGLMIAQKKSAVDQTLIMKTIQGNDVKIDRILFKRFDQEKGKELPELDFKGIDGRWYLYLKDGKQKTRVEGFRIEEMIKQIKTAKNDELADVPPDHADTGLKQPRAVVTFKGRLKDVDKEWVVTIGVGKETVGASYYVRTSDSDHPDKVYAVPRASLDSLLFKDANHLRPKHLFNFTATEVTVVEMKKADKLLELKRGSANVWTIKDQKGPIGPAEYSDTVEETIGPDGKPATLKRPVSSGVKSLLESVKEVRVEEDDDFVPLGESPDKLGVGDNAEMRIDIHVADKKDTETLLIGNKVDDRKKGEVYYYARLAGEHGIMQINSKWLAPIEKAIDKPGDIRSRNLGGFDPKAVDAVVLKDKDGVEFKFFRPEGEAGWQMFAGGKKHKADTMAMNKLFDQLLGKKAIVEFLDVPEAELKTKEAEWGLDAKAALITVYIGGIEKAKKDDEKKEEPKKDDKAKKDESKKDDNAKKDDKKEAVIDKDAPPTLKKDAPAVIVLALGKIDKEHIPVRRKLESGAESRFTLKKEFSEKLFPATGVALAYLDTALPAYTTDDVTAMEIVRTTEKAPEKLELERRYVNGKATWYLKDPAEKTGVKLADGESADLFARFSEVRVTKSHEKLDPKDLDKYGLKNPAITVSITVKKPVSKETLASFVALAAPSFNPHLLAASVVGLQQIDKGELISLKFGKEVEKDKLEPKAKAAIYAQHSGSDFLFWLPAQALDDAKKADIYDRAFMMKAHPEMIASYLGVAAGNPVGARLLAGPHLSGDVHQFNPDTVTNISLTVRTPVELRSFGFTRKDKDKPWTASSGLEDFQLDGNKVTELVKELAKLRTDRFVTHLGGPRMEHKFGAKDAAAKIVMTLTDGPPITLTIGTTYPAHGYFGHSTHWPEAVFFVPIPTIDPLLRGAAHFSKERAGGP